MRLSLVVVTLVGVLFLTRSGLCQNPAWRKFSPAQGGFSVLLPGIPKAEKEVETTAEGTNTFHSFTVERPTGVYIVGYTDFPPGPGIMPSKFMLDQFRDGLIEELGHVKLLGEKDINLQNVPGRAITFRDGERHTYSARLYRVKQRIYHLLAVTSPGDEKRSAGAVQTFLNSFTLPSQPGSAAMPAAWRRFSTAPGNFSVLLPGQPTQETVAKEGPFGVMRIPLITRFGESVVYTVTYFDFPDPEIVKQPQHLLDGFQKGMIIGVHKKLLAGTDSTDPRPTLRLIGQRRLTLKKWPGREIRLRDSNGMLYSARFFLVQQRMFTLNASTAHENESRAAKDIEKFMESFTVLGPAATGDIL